MEHANPQVSRRQVLTAAGALVGSILVAACAQPAATPTAAPPQAAAPTAAPPTSAPPTSAPTPAAAPTTAPPTAAPTQAPAPTAAPPTAATPAPVATTAATAAGPTGKVVMWAFPLTDDDPKNIWNPLLAKFQAQYPNATVEVQMQSWDGRREKMLAAAAAKATPDLAYLNHDMVFPFAQAGAIDPLDDYLSTIAPQLVNDYSPSVIGGLKAGGKLRMLPILSGAVCGLYNKDLYQQVGLDPTKNPTTMDELTALCEKAKAKGLYGLQYRVGNTENFCSFLYAFGGRLISADHQKSLVDSPEGIQTFTYITNLFKQGYVPKAGATSSTIASGASAAGGVDYFVQKKQVSVEYTSFMGLVNQYKKQVPGIQLGILEVLKAPDGSRRSEPTVGCLGIFSAAQNKQGAAYWLTWLMQPDNLVFYNTQGGFVPPTAAARAKWEADPVIKAWGDQVEYIVVDADTQYYFQNNFDFITPALSAAALGQMAPADAAKDAAKKINDYIQRNPL